MKKDYEEYRDTGVLGGYHPEMAVLREQSDGEVMTIFRDTEYLCELDAGILGELLPQEVQPLSRYALHLHLSHSNPNIRLI